MAFTCSGRRRPLKLRRALDQQPIHIYTDQQHLLSNDA